MVVLASDVKICGHEDIAYLITYTLLLSHNNICDLATRIARGK